MVVAVESGSPVVSELQRRWSKRPGVVVCDGRPGLVAPSVAILEASNELGGVQMTQADSINMLSARPS